MNSPTDTIVVITSPFGPVALAQPDLRAALQLASEVVGDGADWEKDHSPTSDSRRVRLFDASEIAVQLGIESTWLLQRARENSIPHIRVGKYVRFDPDEIHKFFHRSPDRHANFEETHPQQHADSKR